MRSRHVYSQHVAGKIPAAYYQQDLLPVQDDSKQDRSQNSLMRNNWMELHQQQQATPRFNVSAVNESKFPVAEIVPEKPPPPMVPDFPLPQLENSAGGSEVHYSRVPQQQHVISSHDESKQKFAEGYRHFKSFLHEKLKRGSSASASRSGASQQQQVLNQSGSSKSKKAVTEQTLSFNHNNFFFSPALAAQDTALHAPVGGGGGSVANNMQQKQSAMPPIQLFYHPQQPVVQHFTSSSSSNSQSSAQVQATTSVSTQFSQPKLSLLERSILQIKSTQIAFQQRPNVPTATHELGGVTSVPQDKTRLPAAAWQHQQTQQYTNLARRQRQQLQQLQQQQSLHQQLQLQQYPTYSSSEQCKTSESELEDFSLYQQRSVANSSGLLLNDSLSGADGAQQRKQHRRVGSAVIQHTQPNNSRKKIIQDQRSQQSSQQRERVHRNGAPVLRSGAQRQQRVENFQSNYSQLEHQQQQQ